MIADREWRVKKDDGVILGPLTLAEVKQKFQEGEVSAGDQVSRGDREFKLISSYPEFAGFFRRPGRTLELVGARPPSHLGLYLGILAVVLVVGGGVALAILWPKLKGSSTTEPDVLQEAVASFSREIPAPTGTAAEAVAAGRKLMLRDERLSYLEADRAFKTALILDQHNPAAIAGWVQNRALLDAHQGDVKERKTALDLIEYARVRDPDLGILHRAKAYLLYSLGHPNEARDSANRALASLQDDPESQLILGASFLDSNTDLAVELFQKALHSNPDLLLAYQFLGEANIRWGKFRRALQFFNERLEKDPGKFEALDSSARVYLEVGQFDKAKELYELILAAEPSRAEAALALARIQTQVRDQAAETVKMLQKLVGPGSKLVPGDRALLLTELSVALRVVGKVGEAIEVAKRALADEPATVPAMYAQAVAEQELGQIPSALQHLRELHAYMPESPRLMARIAEAESQIPNFDAALKDMHRAVELGSADLDVHLMLASLYLFLDNPTQAYTWLRKATAIYPFTDEDYRVLNPTFDGPSFLKLTMDRVQQGAAKFDEEALAQALAGIVLFRAGKPEKARLKLLHSLQLDAGNVPANLFLGVLAISQGHPDNAITFLEQAHRGDALDATVTRVLALALLREGKIDRAQNLYQAVLKADPANIVARIGLADVWLAKKKQDKAFQLAQKVHEADRENLRVKQLLFKMGY